MITEIKYLKSKIQYFERKLKTTDALAAKSSMHNTSQLKIRNELIVLKSILSKIEQ